MPADQAERAAVDRALLGLLVPPVAVGWAALILPHVPMGAALASLVVFAGSALVTVLALAIASRSRVAMSSRVVTVILAAIALGGLAVAGVSSTMAAVVIDTAIVAVSWGIGATIGRHIEHPGHLLPACVVVACADVASLVSQWGPTHAIAESERALSVIAISFPVPGTAAFAPALGAGDLVFMSIVLGAAAVHGLSVRRTAVLCGIGTIVAGLVSAVLETAVPALVPIGAAVVLGLPAVRRVREKERRVAIVAMVIAVSMAAAAIGSQLLHTATAHVAE